MGSLVHTRRRGAGQAGFAVLALTLAGLTAGCDDLLKQEAPSFIEGTNLNTPAAAGLLVTSAIASYECAQSEANLFTGIVSDELIDAQLALAGWDVDRRTLTSASSAQVGTCLSQQVPGFYIPLSQARFQADDATTRLKVFTDAEVPTRVKLLGQSAAYAGYALTLLGENMCTGSIDLSPELTRAQLLAEAEARFTDAITQATAANDATTLNLARLGRARVRLDLNKKADARVDAAAIPSTFVLNGTHSAAIVRRQNRVYDAFFNGFWYSVDPTFRGLTVGGVPDLRPGQVTDLGRNGHDNSTRIWRTNKYPTIEAPSPIAKYAEAQLIIAEIDGGQAAVDIINALRDKASLPHFASADPAEIQAQVIQERSRELYLEGHRLNDMIRANLPLVPAAGTPFGKGGSYGTQLCVPLMDQERQNNPNIPKT